MIILDYLLTIKSISMKPIMKSTLFILLLINILFCIGCFDNSSKSSNKSQSKQVEKTATNKGNKETVFMPDTSINQIKLLNSKSIIQKTGNLMPFIIDEGKFPYVYLTNKNKTQYLKLTFYPGSNKNEFSFFEVGKIQNYKDNKPDKVIKLDNFITGQGIKLGLSKRNLIDIMGNDYISKKINEYEILIYTLDNYNESNFLQRYNFPSYKAKYKFKNNSLVYYSFGFKYP